MSTGWDELFGGGAILGQLTPRPCVATTTGQLLETKGRWCGGVAGVLAGVRAR